MKATPLLADAFKAFRMDPSRPAVIDSSGPLTWGEFMDDVGWLATKIGHRPGREPINILVPSNRSFFGTFLAATTVRRPACTLHQDWAKPELKAAILSIKEFEPDPDDDDPVFYVGFTSGTSGSPKPFARRQKSWASSFAPAGELFSIEAGDVVFLPGSLQHSHFLFGAVLALNRGAAARLFEQFDAELLAQELHAASRGVLYLVPTMLLSLDELGGEPFDGIHSVVVAGAKMEPHHWEIARRLFPEALIGEFYGASELSFVSVNTGGEAADPGYVGRPFPGVELEIRPPEGSAEDGPGLVYVRSPYLFEGYVHGTKTNSPVGEDGFMTVGDIGVLGPEGLSLVGRASNLLITGGKNVHPEEVEAQLNGHPDVAECVVMGVPHPRWGDEIVALVVPSEPGAELDGDDLRDYLKERVAGYKIPKRWFLAEQIPRTRAGKTDRSPERLFRLVGED